VNPAVAVLLGWAFDHEPVTARTLAAGAVIVAAVVVITTVQASTSRTSRDSIEQPAQTEPVSGRA
jgi:hypothetical protein